MKRKIIMAGIVTLLAPMTCFAEDSHSYAGMSDGSKKIHELMEKSSEKMPKMKMSGDVDKDFAKMMADHHRTGLEMAKVQLEHGKDQELKKLAEKIIDSQKKELKVLEAHH